MGYDITMGQRTPVAANKLLSPMASCHLWHIPRSQFWSHRLGEIRNHHQQSPAITSQAICAKCVVSWNATGGPGAPSGFLDTKVKAWGSLKANCLERGYQQFDCPTICFGGESSACSFLWLWKSCRFANKKLAKKLIEQGTPAQSRAPRRILDIGTW